MISIVGIAPLLAGVFNFCLFAPLFGGPPPWCIARITAFSVANWMQKMLSMMNRGWDEHCPGLFAPLRDSTGGSECSLIYTSRLGNQMPFHST